jgi:hypothetical protein
MMKRLTAGLALACAAALAAASAFADTESHTKRMKGNSGEDANFGEWYVLCTDPVPAGGVIVNSSFHLEGDRQCGAWSNCQRTTRSSHKICWSFQMQGHNEGGGLHIGNPNNGSRESTGVLSWVVRTP